MTPTQKPFAPCRARVHARALRAGTALALVAAPVALMLVPAPALAQCTGSPNPTSPVTLNFDDQTLGSPAGALPYALEQTGLTGCPGGNGGNNSDGGPGFAGQSMGPIASTATNVTVLGVSALVIPNYYGALISSVGGDAGYGGDGGSPIFSPVSGGAGGVGGAGGQIAIGFSGSIGTYPGAANQVDIGFNAVSTGGNGGAGGSTGDCCSGGKYGGMGGDGGVGGAINFTGSGTVNVLIAGSSFGEGAIAIQSNGGDGGGGGGVVTNYLVNEIQGGDGGAGGASSAATLSWTSGDISAANFGLSALSAGGDGGGGGVPTTTGGRPAGAIGGDAGAGGAAGNASVSYGGGTMTITANGPSSFSPGGLVAVSVGGTGGDGALASSSFGSYGGAGGAGGAAGSATASILGTINFTGDGTNLSRAILVRANGGPGGAGGNASAIAGSAGGGGLAGAGGAATLTTGSTVVAGNVNAAADYASVAVVQSVGGGGGGGGIGEAAFNTQGGAGAAGGNGDTVTVNAVNGLLLARGRSASGVIAQSVGGGGGLGGDAEGFSAGASLAIGGNGGVGGNGGAVNITLGQDNVIGSLDALGDGGLLAQSIGGSGGAGGSASSTGVAFLTMTVGGDSQGGGAGGKVTIENNGLVTTYGDHAAGVLGQSVGGGGGKGGSGFAFGAGVLPTAAVAIGGRGGGGGPGGDVSIINKGQIAAYGADAFGVQMQSVGGGGGTGGAAAARAVAISPSKYVPAVSVAVAIGGKGGDGNTGGAVGLDNSGLVTTAGHGGIAVFAQSVGGGGGNGGDSTAAAYSGGPQAGLTVSVATSVGGSGGTGGLGGQVNLANSGLIATLGQDAYGVFAQSIGGGGGVGGTGDAAATAEESKGSLSVAIAVGGSGGSGGNSGAVALNSTGAVTTSGDGSDGVFVQSVGGGGGVGSGGVGSAAGGNLAVAVGVGGSGGVGGNGNAATATNGGNIITRGTDSVGIFVQSIGGGGGKAGKGGATAGGVSDLSNEQALFDLLAGGLGLDQKVTTVVDGIYKVGSDLAEITATYDELRDMLKQPEPPDPDNKDEGTAVQINVGIAVGGNGGAAGASGTASVTNTGNITTFGAQSDAIFAQSIGGGGGKGGAATSTGSASDDGSYQTAISVGGNGGSAGNAGNVVVVNGAGGIILTQGVGAFGISAQSVAGGGGAAKASGAVSGSLKSLSLAIGGNGGAGDSGGEVDVTTGDGTPSSTITTTGKHGIAIFAQSLGGGGGLVHTMTSDQTFDPAKIAENPQGRLADVQGFSLTLGGKNGASGSGGIVNVNVNGLVSTAGRTAHGVVAQSIGGGGGLSVGGQLLGGLDDRALGAAEADGNGTTVTVALNGGANLTTAGDGAYGIIAQSIGGGGGIAGDLANVTSITTTPSGSVFAAGTGDGGNVNVRLTGAVLSTSGDHAPGIFAQSVGGGGGLFATAQGLQAGSAGGPDTGADVVEVSLTGSNVVTTGLGSPGIMVQNSNLKAVGGSSVVTIDANSSVTGGRYNDSDDLDNALAGAIMLLSESGNTLNNAGKITGINDNPNTAIAIFASRRAVTISNSSTGKITGNILTSNSGSSIFNAKGGIINSGRIDIGGGIFTNAGTLHVGGIGTIGTTTLNGDLVQGRDGTLVIDADFAAANSDLLTVTGAVRLSGTVEIHSGTASNRPITVLTADSGISLDPALLVPAPAGLFTYTASVVARSLLIGTRALFATNAAAFGGNRQQLAAHLQTLFDSGASYDAGFSALAAVEAPAYARTLDALSGQGLGAIGALRFEQSNGFVEQLMTGCGAFETGTERGDNCGWARIVAGRSVQDGDADALGYRASGGLFQLGYEAGISSNWSVSGSLAYAFDQIDGDNALSKVTGSSAIAGAYLRYHPGGLALTMAVDGGYGWYKSQRFVDAGTVNGIARARPEAWHIGAHAEARYRFETGRVYFQPFAKLHLVHVENKGFAEAGLPLFNLAVDSAGNTAVSGSAGLEIGGNMPIGNGGFVRPFVRASYVVLGNNDWDTTARFTDQPAGTPSFVVNTRAPDRLTRLAVGVNILDAGRIDLSLQYAPEFGSGYTRHAGIARLTARF